MLRQGIAIKHNPTNKNKFLSNLNKCQPSVRATNIVVEPGNLGPNDGSPFLYLFFQDNKGFQNIGLYLENGDL